MSRKRRGQAKPGQQAEPEGPTPTYRASSYAVYPTGYDLLDREGKERWVLTVVDAGNGWAIRRGEQCLNIALQWEKERPLALCDSQFIHRCRYNEHAALLRARRVIDRLEVAGLSFDDFAAQPIHEATVAIDEARRRIARPKSSRGSPAESARAGPVISTPPSAGSSPRECL